MILSYISGLLLGAAIGSLWIKRKVGRNFIVEVKPPEIIPCNHETELKELKHKNLIMQLDLDSRGPPLKKGNQLPFDPWEGREKTPKQIALENREKLLEDNQITNVIMKEK